MEQQGAVLCLPTTFRMVLQAPAHACPAMHGEAHIWAMHAHPFNRHHPIMQAALMTGQDLAWAELPPIPAGLGLECARYRYQEFVHLGSLTCRSELTEMFAN